MSGDRHSDPATDETAERDDDFLTRWSERKTMARQGVELPEPEEDAGVAPPVDSEPDDDAGEAAADGESAAAEPVELPPIESLDENSDYSPFLASGVSPDVRRDALRKLFHSPKFNVRDGLDDYDLDFTNPEPLGDIITAEMRHRMQVELERLAGLRDEEEEMPEEAVAAVDGDAEVTREEPDEPAEGDDGDDGDEQTRAS
jgi:hypothetical protein